MIRRKVPEVARKDKRKKKEEKKNTCVNESTEMNFYSIV